MKEANIKNLCQYYWRKKGIFILVAIISIILALIYIYKFQTPKYKASISISLTRNYSADETKVDETETETEAESDEEELETDTEAEDEGEDEEEAESEVVEGNENSATYIDREAVLLNEELINNYEQMLTSTYILENVIEECSLDYTADDLEDMISTEILDDTTMITIYVESSNASETVEIANSVVEELKQQVQEIYGLDNIKITNPAKEPQETSNLSNIMIIILYLFVGLALIAVVLFTIFYVKV